MHRAKAKHKIRRWWIALIIIVVITCGILFFTPINNAWRSISGNDTPTDSVIKNELVKKINARKTGDPTQDKKIQQAADQMKNTKMSTVISAANNEDKAAQLIQQTSSLSAPEAQKVAHEIFTNSKYTPLRASLSSGNWVQVYQQYQILSKNGSLNDLKSLANN